jgi:hypothetical protein
MNRKRQNPCLIHERIGYDFRTCDDAGILKGLIFYGYKQLAILGLGKVETRNSLQRVGSLAIAFKH